MNISFDLINFFDDFHSNFFLSFQGRKSKVMHIQDLSPKSLEGIFPHEKKKRNDDVKEMKKKIYWDLWTCSHIHIRDNYFQFLMVEAEIYEHMKTWKLYDFDYAILHTLINFLSLPLKTVKMLFYGFTSYATIFLAKKMYLKLLYVTQL